MVEILTFYEFADTGEGTETRYRRGVEGAAPYIFTKPSVVHL